MSNVAEGVGVDARVGAFFDEMSIAGVFALGEDSAAEPPDGGIEPMDDADEVGESGHPKVATLDVAKFVEESHLQGVG